MNMKMNDTYLTIKEACEMLKISRPTIYKLMDSGQIKRIKVGRCVRILQSDLLSEFGGRTIEQCIEVERKDNAHNPILNPSCIMSGKEDEDN